MIFPPALVLSLLLQGTPDVTDTSAPSTQEPVAGVRRVIEDPGSGTTRPPLLREGTFLTAAIGTIVHDEALGTWTFRTESEDRTGRMFGMLPSRALEDMLHAHEADEAGGSFEVTGRILVYDGMNFLLPSIGTPVTRPLPLDTTPEQEAESTESESNAPANSLAGGDELVADRLEARLRDRIGVLPRSSDQGRAEVDPDLTLGEGTRLQNRRGSIVRDQRTGTWRFVFDARGGGSVDPAMELLPCLLLERLQRAAAVSELPPAVLISGEVTAFNGRNYLLPTIWRPTGSGRNLVP